MDRGLILSGISERQLHSLQGNPGFKRIHPVSLQSTTCLKLISSDADYENAIQLLCTIPGVKRDSAITIISKIGTDMTQFSSSKRLCCWDGLTPGSNESAGKKKSVRITRAGVYLKPALVQYAHAAVKSDKSPYYKKKYESSPFSIYGKLVLSPLSSTP